MSDLSEFFKNASNVQNNQINNSFFSTKKQEPEESTDANNHNNSIDDLAEIRDKMSSLTSLMKENKNSSSPGRPILGRSSETGSSETEESEEKPLDKAEVSHTQHLLRTNLIPTNTQDIEILQSDPNDPLYSARTFKELNISEQLMKGIIQMGFRKPSGIQEKALPILLGPNPKNIIAQSQSGTGKTAAFMLTMLSKIDVDLEYCQCLCMAPTRELAIQIANVATTMSRYIEKLKIGCAIKGYIPALFDGQINAHLIVGTPGTLAYWTTEGSGLYFDPRKLRVFVLDEADVLIEEPQFLNIAKRIKSKLNKSCQILLFSATYDDEVMEFAREFVPNPTEFRVKPQQLSLKNIKQYYIELESEDSKYGKLIEIFGMKPIGQCIIFCETKRKAFELKTKLVQDGHLSSLLSGDLTVDEREKELTDFRNAKSRILIATNVCSRGIDIAQVNLIINWDMPTDRMRLPDPETYLHRIGRSGRFGKSGLAINFIVGPRDLQIQEAIINVFSPTIELLTDLEVVANMPAN